MGSSAFGFSGCLLLSLSLAASAFGERPYRRPLRIVEPTNRITVAPDRLQLDGSLNLTVVGETELDYGLALAFGDTDHDGRNEIFKVADSLHCSYRILEETVVNEYALEYAVPCLYPRAVGDLDGDGLSELVGELDRVYVYESTSASTYPTELVWTSPPVGNTTQETTIGDTDGDGQMEIITSHDFDSGSILYIFENRGDNDFEQVFSETIGSNGCAGTKAIGDLDGDGLIEIALSGSFGGVYVFESPADDT